MDIWNRVLGFMDSQVVLTAEELGVFNVLADGGASLDDVAEATDLPEDSARRLMTALCALDLVEKTPGGTFSNTTEADRKLVEGRPTYIGAMFQHVRDDLYPLWSNFGSALKEGEAQWERTFGGTGDGVSKSSERYDDPEALRAFMEGMHAISYRAASQFADMAADELEGVDHVVDVGGASGAFVIALAERYPSLKGTVFDLPPVRPIAEDYFRDHDMSARLDFEGGDFWNDPLPQGADAYSLGFILHDWDTEQGTFLLDKVAGAIEPGGLLVVGEYLLNDERTGPLHVARQDLNMMVAARGRERSAEEYGDWIAASGFELQRTVSTWDGKHFLLARRR